eukprot:gene10575-12302_t
MRWVNHQEEDYYTELVNNKVKLVEQAEESNFIFGCIFNCGGGGPKETPEPTLEPFKIPLDEMGIPITQPLADAFKGIFVWGKNEQIIMNVTKLVNNLVGPVAHLAAGFLHQPFIETLAPGLAKGFIEKSLPGIIDKINNAIAGINIPVIGKIDWRIHVAKKNVLEISESTLALTEEAQDIMNDFFQDFKDTVKLISTIPDKEFNDFGKGQHKWE